MFARLSKLFGAHLAPIVAIVALAMLSLPGSSLGQDRFGSAVSVTGSEIVVSKPLAGQGPASLYVYRAGADGSWDLVQELVAPAGSGAGEAFSPTMAATSELVLVGSGDPDALFGAHSFRSGSEGFTYAGRLPLERTVPAPDEDAPVDLGTVMRILQPPARIVALDGERAVASLAVFGAGTPGVRVLGWDAGSEEWRIEHELYAPEGERTSGFGSAVALRGDRLAVGAPGSGGRGAVFVYERSPDGTWTGPTRLSADDLPPGSRLGESVVLTPSSVLAGAPRTRTGALVVAYTADDTGGVWSESSRIESPEAGGGDLFGASLQVSGDELWIGAPRGSESAGAVYRYTSAGGDWTEAGTLEIGAEAGFAAGTALDLVGDLGVIGAPGADGGRGRAAVLERGESGWSLSGWLLGGNPLDAVAGEEVTCSEDGDAAGFGCSDVDLLAFLPISAIGGQPGESVSDVWGWTDPESGREYSLVGRTGGAAIVDVTVPGNPLYLGVVAANPSGARDLKVYADHLFFTGDGAGNHGLVIFDLTRLRDVPDTPTTFEPDTVYHGIASAHNLVIDTESGFAFPVGSSGGGETCGGGLHMVDIRNPMAPTFAGCYTDTHGLIAPGRTHDAQCTVYSGPDERYRGREICFVSNETALRIVDITDKANPVPIAAASYPGMAYIHQGWLTDDQHYYYLNDELDELVGKTETTRTFIWDVSELDDPVLVGHHDGPDGATDHNLYVKGDRMYQANYQAGLRVFDISDPESPVEIGFFDTTPYEGNPPGFNGAWTAYPYFESGTVVVTSINEGLFLVRPRRRALIP